jgi:drug/metabolite transporter (DMT)-like permease
MVRFTVAFLVAFGVGIVVRPGAGVNDGGRPVGAVLMLAAALLYAVAGAPGGST